MGGSTVSTGSCVSSAALLLISSYLLTQLASVGGNNGAPLVHRRFEYKYSFKPPYLAQKDGTVPFWEYGGNAIASSDSVRIAPSLRSQKGAIWTKSKTNFEWWEAEVVFRVSGRGRIGADGLAFWFTAEKGDYNGEVFGSSDQWVGLAVFFDSFDNDNKHNNPYISAVTNDGTKKFDHQNDGSTQLLSGCLRDFRNKPFPTRARIEYYQNILTVLFHSGMTNNNHDYEMCLRVEGVVLPSSGHFGISAATGGLADDHDVFHFLTTSLHKPGGQPEPNRLGEEDSAKLTAEYQDYQKKLELQKEEYRKEHPDEAQPKEEFAEDWYESDNQRELRQIYTAQTTMTEVLKDLTRKMDEVIGRQERTMGLLSANAGQVAPPTVGGGQPPPVYTGGNIDGMTRPEIDLLMNNNNQLLATAREVRNLVDSIPVRLDQIVANQARAPTAQINTAGYDVQSVIQEMRDGLNQVKLGVQAVGHKIGQPNAQGLVGGCPTCVGLTPILVCAAVQLALMLAYSLYMERREKKAKFY